MMTDIPISSALTYPHFGRIGDFWRNLLARRTQRAERRKLAEALTEFNSQHLRDIGRAKSEMLCEVHRNAAKAFPY